MTDIPVGVLASILDRLDALEQSQPNSAEQLSATYLRVNPNGTVSAVFTGGVQIPEGSSGLYNTGTALAWADTTTGAIREYLTGYKGVGSTHTLGAVSQSDAANNARLLLGSVETAVSFKGSAYVEADAQDSAGGNATVRILNSDGTSGLLQAGAQVLSKVGTASLTWPAGGAFSNGTTITLPGATSTCTAIVAPLGAIGNPAFFDYGVLAATQGVGSVGVSAATRLNGVPGAAGTMAFAYLIWGT